jgi:hypothetical protein
MIHSFNTEIAAKYGIEEAIILNNLTFWIEKNAANGVNFYDGRHWTYNSVEAFAILFPYMSKKKIYRCLAALEKNGVLHTGNYNEKAYDRTKWYALSDDFLLETLGTSDLPKMENGFTQNGEMDFPNRDNAFPETGEPIPDSKPDTKTKDNEFISQVLDLYTEIVLPNCNAKGFIKESFLTNKTRMKSVRARLDEHKDHRTLDFWIAYFQNCCLVPWIRDGIDGEAVCTVDHMFNKTKFWRNVEAFWA